MVSKQYDKQGELLASEWRKPSGEFLTRIYYENGDPKGVSTGVGKDSKITIIHNKHGQPKYKEYKLNNGEKLITKYMHGYENEKWVVKRDGRYIRVW